MAKAYDTCSFLRCFLISEEVADFARPNRCSKDHMLAHALHSVSASLVPGAARQQRLGMLSRLAAHVEWSFPPSFFHLCPVPSGEIEKSSKICYYTK